MKQRIAILGSTGSIGVNTLDVIALHPDRFDVIALTAARNVDLLYAQCSKFLPRYAVMADVACARELAQRCAQSGLRVEVLGGSDAIAEMAQLPEVDAVMAAIVGAAGLGPCMAAAHMTRRSSRRKMSRLGSSV